MRHTLGGRMAETSLLLSKQLAPRLPADLVARPALLARLDAALAGKLTLCVAPAGYGKSTLLAEYARLCAEAGTPATTLDGRNLQPTPDGFVNALRAALNDPGAPDTLPERYVLLVDTYELLAPLDHAPTRSAVEAERAFLARIGGGCQVPIAAYAWLEGATITLSGLIGARDGRVVRGTLAGPV
ncbi:hypothetical protein SE17_34670, partial [Kouleothrix aurantiaca]